MDVVHLWLLGGKGVRFYDFLSVCDTSLILSDTKCNFLCIKSAYLSSQSIRLRRLTPQMSSVHSLVYLYYILICLYYVSTIYCMSSISILYLCYTTCPLCRTWCTALSPTLLSKVRFIIAENTRARPVTVSLSVLTANYRLSSPLVTGKKVSYYLDNSQEVNLVEVQGGNSQPIHTRNSVSPCSGALRFNILMTFCICDNDMIPPYCV